jgi:hypothetical protein
MLVHHSLADRQAQAGALLVGGETSVKDSGQIFFRDQEPTVRKSLTVATVDSKVRSVTSTW